MQTRQRTNYTYLLIGIALLFLMTWAVPSRLLQNPWLWMLFVAVGISIQVFILNNGGFLPKNGKATIHSKIIFWATVVALLTISAFILGIHFLVQ